MRLTLAAAALLCAGPAFAGSAGPVKAQPGMIVSCGSMGEGFVQLPGTQTCVRTGGRVRAEAGTTTARNRGRGTIGTAATGRASIDARTETDLGPMRVFVRTDVARSTGAIGRVRP